MDTKSKLGCVVGILALFISTSIWYYILYQILVAIKASELTWFLFWVYVPVGFIVSILAKIVGQIPPSSK